MSFRSPLRSLLRLRDGLERMAFLELQRANGAIAVLDQQSETLQARMNRWRVDVERQLEAGLASWEMGVGYMKSLKAEAQGLEAQREALAAQRRIAQESYFRRRSEKEMVASLVERSRSLWRLENKRREAVRRDDATLQKRLKDQGLDDQSQLESGDGPV